MFILLNRNAGSYNCYCLSHVLIFSILISNTCTIVRLRGMFPERKIIVASFSLSFFLLCGDSETRVFRIFLVGDTCARSLILQFLDAYGLSFASDTSSARAPVSINVATRRESVVYSSLRLLLQTRAEEDAEKRTLEKLVVTRTHYGREKRDFREGADRAGAKSYSRVSPRWRIDSHAEKVVG